MMRLLYLQSKARRSHRRVILVTLVYFQTNLDRQRTQTLSCAGQLIIAYIAGLRESGPEEPAEDAVAECIAPEVVSSAMGEERLRAIYVVVLGLEVRVLAGLLDQSSNIQSDAEFAERHVDESCNYHTFGRPGRSQRLGVQLAKSTNRSSSVQAMADDMHKGRLSLRIVHVSRAEPET